MLVAEMISDQERVELLQLINQFLISKQEQSQLNLLFKINWSKPRKVRSVNWQKITMLQILKLNHRLPMTIR